MLGAFLVVFILPRADWPRYFNGIKLCHQVHCQDIGLLS